MKAVRGGSGGVRVRICRQELPEVPIVRMGCQMPEGGAELAADEVRRAAGAAHRLPAFDAARADSLASFLRPMPTKSEHTFSQNLTTKNGDLRGGPVNQLMERHELLVYTKLFCCISVRACARINA